MIIRHHAETVLRRGLRRASVVLLVGARQVGKTTLARTIVPPQSENYFDLEDPTDLARLEQPMLASATSRGPWSSMRSSDILSSSLCSAYWLTVKGRLRTSWCLAARRLRLYVSRPSRWPVVWRSWNCPAWGQQIPRTSILFGSGAGTRVLSRVLRRLMWWRESAGTSGAARPPARHPGPGETSDGCARRGPLRRW